MNRLVIYLWIDMLDCTFNKILYHQKCKENNKANDPSLITNNKQGYHMATKFDLFIQKHKHLNQIEVQSEWRTGNEKGQTVLPELLDIIISLFFQNSSIQDQHEGIKLTGLSEYCREGITFCANSNYKNEGPWFDYVQIALRQDNDDKEVSDKDSIHDKLQLPVLVEGNHNVNSVTLIPAKIICFVKNSCGKIYAIVHSCLQSKKKISVLTYQWQLEYQENQIKNKKRHSRLIEDNINKLTPVYHKVSVDTFQKNILMIPLHNQSQYLLEIIDQNQWAQSFATD